MQTRATDEAIQIRAYYLWEADGSPDGQADLYWAKAVAMLDEESRMLTPIDEASAAGPLLTYGVASEVEETTTQPESDTKRAAPRKASTHSAKAKANDATESPARKTSRGRTGSARSA